MKFQFDEVLEIVSVTSRIWSGCGMIPAGVLIELLIPVQRQVVENHETKNGLSEKAEKTPKVKKPQMKGPLETANMNSIDVNISSKK